MEKEKTKRLIKEWEAYERKLRENEILGVEKKQTKKTRERKASKEKI